MAFTWKQLFEILENTDYKYMNEEVVFYSKNECAHYFPRQLSEIDGILCLNYNVGGDTPHPECPTTQE